MATRNLCIKANKPLFLRGRELEAFNKKEKLQNAPNHNTCWMGFPIVSKIKPCGVFVFTSKSNRNALSVKDFEKLIDFFESINLFLEKVSYLKELKRSENLFKSLVNTINEGLIKIDLDSNITFANNRLNEMSGYEQEDVIGKKAIDFLGPKSLKVLAGAIGNRRKGISSQYEMSVKVKSGAYKDFYINGAPYKDENGNIIGSIGTFTDITQKKEQLALFAANETLLNEITSTIDVAFWIYSFETKTIQYLSPAFETIFEETLEEIYKLNSLRKFIHPDDVRAVFERNGANLSSGECEVKYRITTPNGTQKWIQDKSVLIKDADGKAVKLIGYVQEITKLKLTEERLSKSETEKDNIIKSIPDSFMIINKEEEIINSYFKNNEQGFLNAKSKRIHGKKINKVFDEQIANTIIENVRLSFNSRETIVFEINVTLNNSSNWYEIRTSAMNEEKTLMIIRNITSNKNNINAIQKLFNITEQTQELIMITDADG